ncbi:DUF559 domain-containing protein [Amnibacterium kyonggiense]|uniref:Uncharacterized protein DUF559 n=1 Tax=Amnibacterium kyonggiense TaxID=595671 RepID=A0A4R7FE66_9MICO|nr:DUF559 domain-containing protein [Amnibacterium kyonggiense]TDS75619.1 uncharacterized protein DUF559 [Amnibacterium kyonggiense]
MQQVIHDRGGLAAAYELRGALRVSAVAITAAVQAGDVIRVRQGWYGNPWLEITEQHAARVGGQLACSSAAKRLGMWEPVIRALHVCVPVNAARLRSPTSYRTHLADDGRVLVHWTGLDPCGTRTLVSPERCIRQVAACEAPEVALAVAESALQAGVLSPDAWDAALLDFPPHVRRLLSRAGWGSESGTESVFRYRIAKAGVSLRKQVWIPTIGRVDCLIGERLVIELDSRRFHRDAAADRARDARLSALGYRVLRFMYEHVMDDWPMVEAAVLAAIARGDHLAPAA